MKLVIILSLSLFTAFVEAEVTKIEINSMIDQMVANEVFSPEEASKAKLKLNNLNDEQLKSLNANAQNIAHKMPARNIASSNKIEGVHQIDFDGADFKQIQEEVQKSLNSK